LFLVVGQNPGELDAGKYLLTDTGLGWRVSTSANGGRGSVAELALCVLNPSYVEFAGDTAGGVVSILGHKG